MTDTSHDAPHPAAPAANTTAAVNAQRLPDGEVDLSSQSKEFLIARVEALERQLKIRNADCAALLKERQTLLPLQAKCDSQKEMILALREQLDILKVERNSALEAVNGHERAARDAEHQALKDALGIRQAGENASVVPPVGPGPASSAAMTGTGQGARVIKTSHAGTQIIYDSSDISSLGFQSGGAAPYDFLGGMGAYRSAGGGNTQVAPTAGAVPLADDSDDAEVQRAMRRANDEAQLEVKQAQTEAQEEARLRARLEALRRSGK